MGVIQLYSRSIVDFIRAAVVGTRRLSSVGVITLVVATSLALAPLPTASAQSQTGWIYTPGTSDTCEFLKSSTYYTTGWRNYRAAGWVQSCPANGTARTANLYYRLTEIGDLKKSITYGLTANTYYKPHDNVVAVSSCRVNNGNIENWMNCAYYRNP